MQGKVEICGVNTAKLRTLPPEEMEELLKKANYSEHYPSQQKMIVQYTNAFIEDYLRLKPKSADDFNARRSDKSRGWRCVARYHHLGTWTNLIKHLGLPKFSEVKPKRLSSKISVVVHNDYDFRD